MFRKISHNFLSNFHAIFEKFHEIFSRFSGNFQEIFTNSRKKFRSIFKKILPNIYLRFSHLFVANYAKVYFVPLCFLPFSAGADRQPAGFVCLTEVTYLAFLNIYLWFHFTLSSSSAVPINFFRLSFSWHIIRPPTSCAMSL